jgi:hypothetical protein
VEINEIVTRRINETKNWFFKKIKKIGKPFVKLTKRKRRYKLIKLKINFFNRADTNEIQRIIGEYFKP